ncbi:MAG: 30S ribosomal protein S3 [Candidatus Nanoarchaeia archaeon]|jgi:small subunit ribosomal protein S3
MIERKFIEAKVNDYKIKTYLKKTLDNAGFSKAEIEKTPLGVKITIHTSKPGLIVGKSGSNIKNITEMLREQFGLENPQLEIEEIMEPELDAQIIAERIVYQLKRFGKAKFKAIGYKSLQRMISAGAIGAEVVIAGRIPGKRHNTWRFKGGRLPKNGNIADTKVRHGFEEIQWKQGTVGIKVSLLTPDVKTPDSFKIIKEPIKSDN